MPKHLVIVESPAKAKTIARYLGKDYVVKSSFGHIRDLPKKDIGVDIEKGFKPTYEIPQDKQALVKDLKSAAKSATIWLASDEDREGEAIAWHICAALGLDPASTHRLVFHEITEPAIKAAISKPRKIDMKLVDAQQARRILDRLVGYELSPVLWKKVRTGLSAGRVQSVAVRLIVEREREIKAFEALTSFKITANFDAKGRSLPAELSERLKTDDIAVKLLSDAKKASFTVSSIEQKPGTRSPGAPFTTSTLQQEASRRLGFSVKQTMTIAQKLYEAGLITYMRTDSTHLSQLAVDAAQTYIKNTLGEKYSRPTQYKTKSRGAQEAHEAIRPTDMGKPEAGRDSGQTKLYGLIWRRAVASQMTPASIEKTEAVINMSGRKEFFLAAGEVLNFDGFLKIYGGGKEDRILPPLEEGMKLNLKSMTAIESYDRAPARYGEASLVKKLEELGIGRPSTYAPTISTIQTRGYVEKRDLEGEQKEVLEITLKGNDIKQVKLNITIGADRGKLMPTELADIVTDFLVKHFSDIVDYDFTAKAEEELDDIADGKLTWEQMLETFYKRLHPLVKSSEKVSRAEVVQERKLGKDPKSGQNVYVRFGRFGPVLQLGDSPKDKKGKEAPKPRFAPLPDGATLDEVTLKQALPMFKLPRIVGQTKRKEEITANIGRFGPYVKVGKEFFSIKGLDPMTITAAEAIRIIADKKKAEAKRVIADFGKVQVLNGPYGPYVTDGKKNAKIPKGTNPEKLDEKSALEMIAAAPVKRFRSRRK